jgi:predicted MFS family arabinose efflux permease
VSFLSPSYLVAGWRSMLKVSNLTSVQSHQSSAYRWLILCLVAITGFIAVGFQITALSVLLDEVADELGLDIFQRGVVVGMTAFMGILTVLVSGPLIDYVGTRYSIVALCLLVGISGALRGLANGFATLLIFSFLLGIFQPVISVSLIKINRLWFGKHQLGLANGFMSSGYALGLMLGARLGATVLSPELDGWRNVLLLLGSATFLVGIVWWLFYPKHETRQSSSINFSLLYRQVLLVSKLRSLWILGGVGTGITALMYGVVGYVPSYLRDLGWEAVNADSAVATFFLASLIGAVPLSTLSDRLHSRRSAIVFAIFMLTLGTSMLFLVRNAYTGVFVAMVIAGCGFDAFMAIHASMVSEVEGIAAAMMGTAIGFAMSIRNIGSAIGPPLGNSFATIGLSVPFLIWAACGTMALILMIRFIETSSSSR